MNIGQIVLLYFPDRNRAPIPAIVTEIVTTWDGRDAVDVMSFGRWAQSYPRVTHIGQPIKSEFSPQWDVLPDTPKVAPGEVRAGK